MNNAKTQRFFVTGANGFIGQHLVKFLAEKGHYVTALIRRGSMPAFFLHEHIHVVYGDIRDEASLRKAISAKSYVVNLAANPYHKHLSYEVNVLGTEHLLAAAKKNNVLKFIEISSQATKIQHKGVYATTKLLADELVKNAGLPYLILKPSLVYGVGEKGLFAKIAQLAAKLPLIPVFGTGKVMLYPIEVQDLCALIEHAALDPKTRNETFDLGGKDAVSYNKMYTSIAEYLSNRPGLLHIPTPIGMLMAKTFSIMPNPPFFEDNILGSTQDTHCDPFPLLKRFRYTPTSWEKGVQSVFAAKKIRVGIVGLGKMGMLHATILRTFSEVEIVALIDLDARLFSTFQTMGISGTFYPSLTEALKNEKLDAVYITTPTFVHLPLLKEAVKHKLHVFIEKPVTLNAAELKEVRSLKSQKIIRVGYTLLFHRPFQKLIELLGSNTYGSIRSWEAKFAHGEVLEPKKGWMFNKKLSGGGVLMNPGPHLFSVLNACFGKPIKVEGNMHKKFSLDVEDEANFIFKFPKYTGAVSLSWSVPGQHIASYSIHCICKNAIIDATQDEVVIRKGNKKTVLKFSQLEPALEHAYTVNPHAFGEAYFMESYDFIDAIKHGNSVKALNSIDHAVNTESLIQLCYAKGKSI